METKFKQIDSTVTGLTVNYTNVLASIKSKIKTKNYILKINGTEIADIDSLSSIAIDITKLTKTGRKKVAKRLYNYDKHGTLKTINFLFHVLKKMNVIDDKVSVDISHKEVEIQTARKTYIKLRTEAEIAMNEYKSLKGDFYK